MKFKPVWGYSICDKNTKETLTWSYPRTQEGVVYTFLSRQSAQSWMDELQAEKNLNAEIYRFRVDGYASKTK